MLDLKRPEEAIGKYQEATRHAPNRAFPYVRWGNGLLKLKRPEEAIEKYQEALRRDPDDAHAYHSWGDALLDLGRDDEASAKRAIYDCLSQGRTSGECLAPAEAGTSASAK